MGGLVRFGEVSGGQKYRCLCYFCRVEYVLVQGIIVGTRDARGVSYKEVSREMHGYSLIQLVTLIAFFLLLAIILRDTRTRV